MTDIDDKYPSNTKRRRATSSSKKKEIKAVAQGVIVERQKPVLLRIFGENTHSVGNYVLWDVLIPALKNTITEMISNGIEMLVYGEPKRNNLRRSRDRTYVSYTDYYDRQKVRARYDEREQRPSRDRHRFDNVIINSRADAEEVLSNLVDLVEDYGIASVADFYELVGINAEWTDNQFGWTNLSRASVVPARGGYILDLPRPSEID